jgi:hypothetical protein
MPPFPRRRQRLRNDWRERAPWMCTGAHPLYTVPYALCVVATSSARRGAPSMRRGNTMCVSWQHHVCVVATPCVRRGNTVCAPWQHRVCVVATPCVRRGNTVCAPWQHRVCAVATSCVRRGDRRRTPWRTHSVPSHAPWYTVPAKRCGIARAVVRRSGNEMRHSANGVRRPAQRGTPFRQRSAPIRAAWYTAPPSRGAVPPTRARCREPRVPVPHVRCDATRQGGRGRPRGRRDRARAGRRWRVGSR